MQLESFAKQLNDFCAEYEASFFCLILIPTIIERIDGDEWIREEDVFLAGHGPKERLLEMLIKRLEDVEDGYEDQK